MAQSMYWASRIFQIGRSTSAVWTAHKGARHLSVSGDESNNARLAAHLLSLA